MSATRYVVAADRTGSGTFDATLPSGEVIPVSWSSASTLTIDGAPGSTASVSIGSLAKPLTEPLVDYPFINLGPNGEIFDRQLSLDASSTGLSIRPGGLGSGFLVAEFDGNARVEVPDDPLLDRTSEIGFGIKLKPTEAGATIVDYALVGLRLLLTGEGRFRVEADTGNGVVTVESAPASLDEWQEVGVAFRNGQLQLEVDGTPYAVPVAGELTPAGLDPDEPALTLGEGYVGLVEWLRVNDWTRQSLLEFADSGDGSLTIGPDGTGTVTIQATGAMTANAAGYRKRLQERWERGDADGYLKLAYAQGLPAHCAQPPPDDEFGIDAMEEFVRWVADCYFGQQIQDARVRIDQGSGIKSLFLGYTQLATLTAIQKLWIHSGARMVSMAKCVDGFVLGGGGSAQAMLCDVASGFFLYGDIRDFVLHEYYWAWNVRDEETRRTEVRSACSRLRWGWHRRESPHGPWKPRRRARGCPWGS